MGMFDYVNYECTCPVCHNKVDGFQSKRGSCEMEKIEPSQVDNFYSSCGKCGCWIDFTAKEMTNFTRTVTGKNEERLPDHTKDVNI